MDIQLWREILNPYVLAVDELVVKFNHLIGEYRSSGEYCPIEQVEGRVKKYQVFSKKHKRKVFHLQRLKINL